MFGHIPSVYVIKSIAGKWWLRHYEDSLSACVWTKSSMKAHRFETKEECQDYINKYLKNRDVTVDEKITHPLAYAYGYGYGG